MDSAFIEKNLAQEGGRVAVWNVRPFQLVSLLDMIRFLALNFVYMLRQLEALEQNLSQHGKKAIVPTELSDEHDKYIRLLMPVVIEQYKKLNMEQSRERGSRLMVRINGYAGDRSYLAVQHDVRVLRETLEYELDHRLFMHMPKDEADYYQKDELFGAEVKARFPEANKEITEAGNCYATGSYTACVFHLMRAVEIGARKLVNALHARKYLNPPNRPIELCTWDDLLKALDKSVADLAAGTRTNTNKKATYEFYNHVVAQFRNFKDAWRNNVSHTRKIYQAGGAKDVMDNTRQFMQHLAERLKE